MTTPRTTTTQMDREAFKRQVRAELETLLEEVADAVDNAPAGRIIRDSEEKVRDAFAEFRRKTFEQALQKKVNAAEAAFPPSGQPGHGKEETA
ncbi:MAG: hypothetical protein GY949_16990 [Gammaproteobacteria bacterium]|nr:hypothetical protein [Gammaproteobacteria bacterium]